VPVEVLISAAYSVPSRDIVDAPQWIVLNMNGGERYDVSARATEGSSTHDQRRSASSRHSISCWRAATGGSARI
jgi:uncharacterized protein (TIGR03435 family)